MISTKNGLTELMLIKKKKYSAWGKLYKLIIYIVAILIHLVLVVTLTFQVAEQEERKDNTIFKMVDITEYVEKKEEVEPKQILEVPIQDAIAEEVTITEKQVVEVEKNTVVQKEKPIQYLPQHKISVAPVIPTNLIRSRIKYPKLANKQKIEGVVYLELYIDARGNIRDILVLKDPGYGLAEAAIEALDGISCEPAKANGEPVAVRYRYPIRFQLK